jgi:hypothetical protein
MLFCQSPTQCGKEQLGCINWFLGKYSRLVLGFADILVLVQKLEGIQWTIRQVEMDLNHPHEDRAIWIAWVWLLLIPACQCTLKA